MPKLFVIPAADAPTAAIIRRGPSAWSHIIKWDTREDRFSHGAWIKGRIYEDRCDLSPNGSLFLYFVFKGSSSDPKFTDAWTAVSRLPWLSALTLWPQGGTWGGGGRFIDNGTICLRGVLDPPHADFPLRGLRVIEADTPLHSKTDDVENCDWCGRDHRRRLIFSRHGQLFHRSESGDTLIADFTEMSPTPTPAPEWAQRRL